MLGESPPVDNTCPPRVATVARTFTAGELVTSAGLAATVVKCCDGEAQTVPAAFTALADGYRRALAEYVDPVKRRTPVLHFGKHPPMTSSLTTAADTLKKLDALDVQRRAIETGLKPAAGFP